MKHTKFILTPITSILKDAVSASSSIGTGIETYPLCDYIMQSIFLKMTGSQEQKFKCICWDIATDDFEYRYRNLLKNGIGECSNLSDKNKIYKTMVEKSSLINDQSRKDILINTKSSLERAIQQTVLEIWLQNDFFCYRRFVSSIHKNHFATTKNDLFSAQNLKDAYITLYDHRNRCAHILLSYQHNIPTLDTLRSDKNTYNNYFVQFFVLILIDNIIIHLYQKCLEKQRDAFAF